MAMRSLVAALALALLLAAPADARRLKPAGKLRATAVPGAVQLTWKDRARGETRWVVRRAGRKAKLRAGLAAYGSAGGGGAGSLLPGVSFPIAVIVTERRGAQRERRHGRTVYR